jgi:hypothetical protein
MESLFAWTAPEYEYRPRSSDWYWWVGTFGFVGAGAAIWFENYLLGGLLVLGTLLLLVFSKREPLNHEIVIDETGISIDGTLYAMNTIDHFWIAEPVHNQQYARLIIHRAYSIQASNTYLIDSEIPLAELREFLLQFTTEKEYRESDTLVRLEEFFS